LFQLIVHFFRFWIEFSRLIDKRYLENDEIENIDVLKLQIELFIIFIYFLADVLVIEKEVETFKDILEIALIYIVKKKVCYQLVIFN